ncbi:MAG: lipocalin family protein [Chitinophagales bacterium]|jgi:hypothetical protein|nr:lipocalin family protein [Chitinophagales bacterium]
MNKFLSFLLTAAFIITMSGCSKSAEDKLTGHAWKATGMLLTLSTGETFDFFALFVQDCDKDDFSTFNENGTITADEGATKCEPTAPQTYDAGTWTLNDAGDVLTITEDGESTTFNITTLSSDKLEATYTYVDEEDPDLSGTIKITWVKP